MVSNNNGVLPDLKERLSESELVSTGVGSSSFLQEAMMSRRDNARYFFISFLFTKISGVGWQLK